MSSIFLPEGKVEIFYNNAGAPERLGELVGAGSYWRSGYHDDEAHPPRGWSHHTTP